MNSIIESKKLIKIAKQLIALYCIDIGDWYVKKNVVKKYDKIVEKLINNINNKLKSFNLPFDYSLQYHDNLIYGDHHSYNTTLDQYGLQEESVGIALFSQQSDLNVLPVAINVPLLNSYLHLGIYTFSQIQKQIEITLWHELAHGLIQRFIDDQLQIPFNVHDQQICQQFGKSLGNLNKSKLGRFINNFIKQNNQ